MSKGTAAIRDDVRNTTLLTRMAMSEAMRVT